MLFLALALALTRSDLAVKDVVFYSYLIFMYLFALTQHTVYAKWLFLNNWWVFGGTS